MILKFKTYLEGTGPGWKFVDNITRVNSNIVKSKPEIQTNCHIVNTPAAQNEATDVAFNCILLDCSRGGEEYIAYTELPVFLLNDKGETIERLN